MAIQFNLFNYLLCPFFLLFFMCICLSNLLNFSSVFEKIEDFGKPSIFVLFFLQRWLAKEYSEICKNSLKKGGGGSLRFSEKEVIDEKVTFTVQNTVFAYLCLPSSLSLFIGPQQRCTETFLFYMCTGKVLLMLSFYILSSFILGINQCVTMYGQYYLSLHFWFLI